MKDVALTVPLVVAATYLRLVGQNQPSGLGLDPGISTLVGNVGVIGVLIWHLWYQTTHSQPQMVKSFAEEVAKLRADRERERAGDEAEKRELREMLLESLRSDRRAVHDIRDTAATVINKVNAAAAEEKRRQQP